MKRYFAILFFLIFGCSYVEDTSQDKPSLLYFKANNTEYSLKQFSILNQTLIHAQDVDRNYGIDIAIDSLKTGRYPIDSDNASYYRYKESYGRYASFGRTTDSISIVVDTVEKKTTGHFEFWATNERDTVFINNGAFISYWYY
jgi:hypothetical protein